MLFPGERLLGEYKTSDQREDHFQGLQVSSTTPEFLMDLENMLL